MKNELLKPALIELRAAPELPDIAYDKSIIKKDGTDNRHKFLHFPQLLLRILKSALDDYPKFSTK